MERCLHTLAVASALLMGAGSAAAQTTTYEFGQLLSGAGAPTDLPFATLTATLVGADIQFTLDAYGLDLFTGSAPFIGALAIAGDGSGTSVANVTGDAPVSLANGGGPGGGWSFRFDLTGPKANRLTDDETVSWTWVGGAGQFDDVAAHVQGIDYGATSSAWYGVTSPVPEPGTLPLALASLGVLGLVARRRMPR